MQKKIDVSDDFLVTIITPTFNQGQFIEETIKSVLNQSYSNIEYIILDAMSTDCTAEILERYRDRVTKIICERDKGQSDAIVKGFKMAQGELVGWINSDDLLYRDCVEKIVNNYKKNINAVLFYNSKIDLISEDGSFNKVMDVPIVNRDELLRKRNTLVQPGSFYKRDALIKVGYFNESLRFSMDLDLWLRLLKIGDAINVGGAPIAAYREWSGTKTSTGDAILLNERKKMLLGHGASSKDRTIRIINFGLLKIFIKNIPIIGALSKKIVARMKS